MGKLALLSRKTLLTHTRSHTYIAQPHRERYVHQRSHLKTRSGNPPWERTRKSYECFVIVYASSFAFSQLSLDVSILFMCNLINCLTFENNHLFAGTAWCRAQKTCFSGVPSGPECSNFVPLPFLSAIESHGRLFHAIPSSKSLFFFTVWLIKLVDECLVTHNTHTVEQGASGEEMRKNPLRRRLKSTTSKLWRFLRSSFHPKYFTSTQNNMHHTFFALSGIDLRLADPVLAYINLTSSALKFPSNLLLPSKCPPRFFHSSLCLFLAGHIHTLGASTIACLKEETLV